LNDEASHVAKKLENPMNNGSWLFLFWVKSKTSMYGEKQLCPENKEG
jgi:hypothetical protein